MDQATMSRGFITPSTYLQRSPLGGFRVRPRISSGSQRVSGHNNSRICSRAAADAVGAAGGPANDPQEDVYKVFPRRKERDPYKLLGVAREAYFEEVQDARNYLYEEFKWHAPSRESIELAYDTILQEKMNSRNKFGFKPRRTGRKTDMEAEPERLSLLQRFQQVFEPSVPLPTIVNDGSIFVILGLWASWQSASADPTLPIVAAIALSVYRLFDKRKKRDPEGPFFGNSPVWGALGTTFLGLFFGFIASTLVGRVLPIGLASRRVAVGLFMTTMSLGMTCIFCR